MKMGGPIRAKEKTIIRLQVIFGAPSQSCAGSGICKMLPLSCEIPDDWKCRPVKAEIQGYRNGTLDLLIHRDQLREAVGLKQSPENTFCLEEDFNFPLWLNKKMEYGQVYIPAGHYEGQLGHKFKLKLKWEKLKINRHKIAIRALL